VAHAKGAHCGFADCSENFGEEIFERLAPRVALAELDCLVFEVIVAERLEVVFEVIYGFRIALETTQESTFTYAQCAFENVGHRLLHF
jgi:hypothetical protein